MTTLQKRKTSSLIGLIIPQAITAIASGALVFSFGVILAALTFQVQYLGKVYPGVHVGDADLSGVRRSELVAFLNENIPYTRTATVTFQYEEETWRYTPEELGARLDLNTSAQSAYLVGREGTPWDRWSARFQAIRRGIYLSPQIIFDGVIAQARLNEISIGINRPAIEAELHVDNMTVSATPGQIGRVVDTATTANQLQPIFLNMQPAADLPVIVLETYPLILDADKQAEIGRTILSQPLSINVAEGDGGPWILEPITLAGMLTIERVTIADGAQYQVGLENAALQAFLAPLAPNLTRDAVDAKYIFNDETGELDVIETAVIGRELLFDESIAAINQQLADGAHQVDLVFGYTQPELTNETTGEELGITELVSVQTTYFYGSSSARMQNIQAAAARFHGLLVPPGAVFSMVDNIGDISLDTGFAEALIIYGDRTIKGVGGGVCQVSTTLFRTVFFGGFPVVERYSHAYRVYYYELAASGYVDENLAGLDATVYSPIIDFKFQNDTPYWLLMEVYVDIPSRSIMWKFYSTNDGREVNWSTTGLQNIIKPPKPLYEESSKLSKGEVDQVDWAVEGADVTITRTVIRDGDVLHYDEFTTHYSPWQTVCQYGKGTKNYPPKTNKQDVYSCKSVSK